MEETKSIVLSKEDFVEIAGQHYMSLRELSKRLGYAQTSQLWKLYNRNKDELSRYSGIVKMATPGGKQDVLCLNEIGCYTIAMLAQTEKAKEFRFALAALMVDLRKKNLHLVPNEIVEQLKKELDQERLEKLMFRMNYYKAEQELKIRKIKGLNFTNAKIIDKMNAKCIPVEDIAELTGLNRGIVAQYLKSLIPALESYKQYLKEKEVNNSFFMLGKDKFDLTGYTENSLYSPKAYLNKGE